MELETVNKLYLELSQVATAKTAKEIDLVKERDEALDDIQELRSSLMYIEKELTMRTDVEFYGKNAMVQHIKETLACTEWDSGVRRNEGGGDDGE